ncbi:MAG TPA: FtsX-like permease family protein [Actinomycetes bacterium]|nr:FtsX-like permease family protein [Actinomycetes bacterium]
MLSLTLRGLAAHKRRLVSTVLAVLLGVAFMAGSLIFTDTMGATLSGVYANAERGTDVLVRGPATIEGGYGMAHAPVADTVADEVAALPGVAAVAPRVEGYAQVVDSDGKAVDDIGMGAAPAGAAWTEVESLNPFRLVDGRGPQADDEVVVDRSLAEEVGLAPSDRTTVLTAAGPTQVEVVGVATFGDADNRAGNRTVLFTLDTAQRVLGREGTVDSIAVDAEAGVSQQQAAQAVRGALGDRVEAVTGTALTEEIANRSNEDVSFFGTFMQIFAGVALLVGAFIINNTFAILVAQRTKELALLRAIGASGRQVRRSVAVEAATVGVIASALGLLAGIGVAKGIQSLFSSFGVTLPEGPLVISPTSLLVAFAVGVVVTVVSAMLPARRAARVAPVAAMRDVAVEKTGVSRVRLALGLLLTAGSVLAVVLGITSATVPLVLVGALAGFLGVATLSPVLARPVVRLLALPLPRTAGIRGLLARENAVRNPKRTAATASALMIGVALVGAITVFAASGKWSVTNSFDKEFRGDLVLETGAWIYGGAAPALAEELAATDGVAVAVPKQWTRAQVEDGVTDVAGWPAETVESAFDIGVSAGSLADMGTDGVAVGARHAEEKGWELGSTVDMTFASGAEKSFVVRALFDHPDWTGQLWVDRAAFAAAVPGALDASVYVVGEDGAGPGLRSSVDSVAAAYGNVEVMNRAQLRQSVVDGFNSMLGIVYALLALAILIALVGIANTVALSVVERTRELGLLRAVGMSRGHLRGMVRWEAALMAVYGTLLGLGVGLFLGWSLVFAIKESGIETARMVVPFGQLALIVAIAGSCGVVAALLPARRAARLDVLDAVATT